MQNQSYLEVTEEEVRKIIKKFERAHKGCSIMRHGVVSAVEARKEEQPMWKDEASLKRIHDMMCALPFIIKAHNTRSDGSYGLAHRVSRHSIYKKCCKRNGVEDKYFNVSNGEFMVAALICGFEYNKKSVRWDEYHDDWNPDLTFKVMCFDDYRSEKRRSKEKKDAWDQHKAQARKNPNLDDGCAKAMKSLMVKSAEDKKMAARRSAYKVSRASLKSFRARYRWSPY